MLSPSLQYNELRGGNPSETYRWLEVLEVATIRLAYACHSSSEDLRHSSRFHTVLLFLVQFASPLLT